LRALPLLLWVVPAAKKNKKRQEKKMMLALFLASTLCFAPAQHPAHGRSSPRAQTHAVSWSVLTAAQMRQKLHAHEIAVPDWVPARDVFYLAEAEGAEAAATPLAVVSCGALWRGRPVARMCTMNRSALRDTGTLKKLWPAYEAEFGFLPRFEATKFFC
jgi:hypothetical protein